MTIIKMTAHGIPHARVTDDVARGCGAPLLLDIETGETMNIERRPGTLARSERRNTMRWGDKRYYVGRRDGDTWSGTPTDDARTLVDRVTDALDDGAQYVMVTDEENRTTLMHATPFTNSPWRTIDLERWSDMVAMYAADRGLTVERTYHTQGGYYRAVVADSTGTRIAVWARSKESGAPGYRVGRDGRRKDRWDWKSQTRKPTNRGARGGCVN